MVAILKNQLKETFTYHALVSLYVLFITYVFSIFVIDIIKGIVKKDEDENFNQIKGKNFLEKTFRKKKNIKEEVEVVAENGSMDSARESELINNEENVGGLNTSNATEGETHQLKNKGKTAEVGPSIAVYPVAVEANKTPLPQFGSTYTAEKLEKHFDEDYSFTSKIVKFEYYREIWFEVFLIYAATVFLSILGHSFLLSSYILLWILWGLLMISPVRYNWVVESTFWLLILILILVIWGIGNST